MCEIPEGCCPYCGEKIYDALTEPMLEDKHWQTIEKLRRAYHLARNAAIGLSNYCEESASTRACGKELTQAEEIYRTIDFNWWNEAVGRAEARKG
jgi:hypothetical protein